MKNARSAPVGVALSLLLLAGCDQGATPFGNESEEAVAVDVAAAVLGVPEITNDLSTYAVAGNHMEADGVGLKGSTMGSITVNVPGGATVTAALLYWGARGDAVDPSVITVEKDGESIPVEGDYAGETVNPIDDSHTLRADLTGTFSTAFGPGANTVDLTVELAQGIEGASLLIAYTDGTSGFLDFRDGNDFAYLLQVPAEQTELQEFSFPPEAADRDARLWLIVGDVEGARPNRIDLEIDEGLGPTGFPNELGQGGPGRDGDEWDTYLFDGLTIPAGGDFVRVQLFSDDVGGVGDPASLYWVVGALEVSDPPEGGQGCTPGYWKQPHHFDSWVGHDPDDLFSSVFEDAFGSMTLLDVLKQGGGGLNALGRHTVAALLNAASGNVDYDMTEGGVIDAFNDVYPGTKNDYNSLKNELAGFNEQGCPLN